ncbi:MAG: T9SS type A sorting domain-containing protein [bacterium]|nr:T9SS type A sorting domain-containing protein [bacterium]
MVRKNLVMGIVSLLLSCVVNAQAPNTLWTKTFGGTSEDWGNSVQETSDGGFIIVGGTYSFGAGNYDVYLIKTNSTGDTLWTKTFGGTNWDEGHSVQETSDGGFIIAGYTESFGADTSDSSNVYLIRTNSTGDSLWTKIFGGTNWDEGHSVQETSDGGFIIAGYTYSFGADNADVYLVRTNSTGDTLWTKTFGGIYWDYGNSIQKTSDGGFIIVGGTYSFGAGYYDVYLIKTNSMGDTLWTKTFGGTYWDEGYLVQETSDGGFVIAGYTYSFGAGNSDVYLIRTNSTGDILWAKTFGGINDDIGKSVQETSDGGFIIVGGTASFGTGYYDAYLIKTNSTGDTLWTKTFGGTYWDEGYSVQQVSDGGFIIAGYTGSFGAGYYDTYLIRVGAQGIEEQLAVSREQLAVSVKPNPFVKSTIIKYQIPVTSKVLLTLYDITGSCVKTLVNEQKSAGTYITPLNAEKLKTGIYFLTLSIDNHKEIQKLAIIR